MVVIAFWNKLFIYSLKYSIKTNQAPTEFVLYRVKVINNNKQLLADFHHLLNLNLFDLLSSKYITVLIMIYIKQLQKHTDVKTF